MTSGKKNWNTFFENIWEDLLYYKSNKNIWGMLNVAVQ